MTVQIGPDRKIKWGTPEGARDPATGDYLHDDLYIRRLVGVLDEQEWPFGGPALVVRPVDPLARNGSRILAACHCEALRSNLRPKRRVTKCIYNN